MYVHDSEVWWHVMKKSVSVTLWEDSPHAIVFLYKGRYMTRRLHPHELPDELKYKLAMLTTAPDSFSYEDSDNDIGWQDALDERDFTVLVSKETFAELAGGVEDGDT